MIDESRIRGDGRAAEEAAGWFARLQGEAATVEDWMAFEQWLAASPAHARAYERLERLWVDLESADIVRELGERPAAPVEPAVAGRASPRPSARPSPRPGRRGAWMGAGARRGRD
jgi:transmembrane sensor